MDSRITTALELSDLTGPSGFEREVGDYIENCLKPLGYTVERDAFGQVVARKEAVAEKAPSVAFFAHMDEVGFMVQNLLPDGTVRGYMLGGIAPTVLPGSRVRVRTADGREHKGIIRAIPPHLKDAVKESGDFIFDFGFTAVSELSEAGIVVGCPIVFDEPAVRAGRSLMGKALDDRVGCAALVSLAEKIVDNSYDFDVVFVFTAQEEVGARGAQAAAYRLKPDLAVVVDISPVMKESGHRGQGVLIRRADRTMIAFPALIDYQIKALDKYGFKHQDYISLGGTDAGTIHLTRGGIPTLTMCLAAETIHAPSALLDALDYLELIDGLWALLAEMSPAKLTDFNRG